MKNELLIHQTRRDLHRTHKEVKREVRRHRKRAERVIKRNVNHGKRIAKTTAKHGKRIAKNGFRETYDSYRIISGPIRVAEFIYRTLRIKMKK